MKTLNRICQVLAIALALGSLVLFFTHFVTIVAGGENAELAGAVAAFGGKVKVAGTEYRMAKSEHVLICFITTVLALVFSALTFKSKRFRYYAPAAGIFSAIYVLVISLAKRPIKFIDTRPLPSVSSVILTKFVLITAIALFAYTVVAVAYLLIDDYLEVLASKGQKITIPKRIVRFFRDYKSEIKKIVWPSFKDVVKNTVIVLLMCLLIGILIWVIDYGLGKLLTLILGV